jgi:protein-S-isoprenylcysteine O-methyltransferase Ste14
MAGESMVRWKNREIKMRTKMAVRICILIAALITLLGGVSASLQFYWGNNWPFVAMGVGTGAITFFGLLILCQTSEERWKLPEDSMRTVIAGTIVVEYLALVGTVAFFVQGEMPPITQTMITNFTTIVGIVIAFYFGASAVLQLQRERQENLKTKADEKSKDTTATPSEAEKT